MRVLAIALQTIRSAFRLKLVLSLLLLLVAALFGVPATSRGDGTAVSEAHVMLFYTLGTSVLILAVATLWASCAAVSREIEGRQMRLLAVKPVRFFSIWLGKWLGIVALDALLLAVVGGAVLVWVHLVMGSGRWSDDERRRVLEDVLTTRHLLLPRPDDLSPLVAKRLSEIEAGGALPEGASTCDLADEVRKRVAAEQSAVAAGRGRTWTFDELPRGLRDGPFVLRYRMASNVGGGGHIEGTWRIANQGATAPFVHRVSRKGGRRDRLEIPMTAMNGSGAVHVTFANADRRVSRTAVFEGDDAVALLAGRS